MQLCEPSVGSASLGLYPGVAYKVIALAPRGQGVQLSEMPERLFSPGRKLCTVGWECPIGARRGVEKLLHVVTVTRPSSRPIRCV